MVFKNQFCALFRRQAVFDKGEIYIFVAAVKLVADDGVAEMREMDADLVFTAGSRDDSQQREISFRARKFLFDPKFRLRRRAVGAHAIFDGNAAALIFAERNSKTLLGKPTRTTIIGDNLTCMWIMIVSRFKISVA